jgi:hypothetical protein
MSREEGQMSMSLNVHKMIEVYVTKDGVILSEDEDEAMSSWIALIGHAGT